MTCRRRPRVYSSVRRMEMKLRARLSAGWAMIVIVMLVVAACGGSSAEEATLSGEELLEARCTDCHGLAQVTSATKTEAEWLSTVDRMIGLGATLNEAEKDTLVSYLAEMYGP